MNNSPTNTFSFNFRILFPLSSHCTYKSPKSFQQSTLTLYFNSSFVANDHPDYLAIILNTNTPDFLIQNLSFFPDNTYYNTANENLNTPCVDKYTLLPTLSWISYYNFTNSLQIPLKNNSANNKLCDTIIHHLTTALHENQFTTIGLNQTLNRFIAPKANQLSINHFVHAVARYMEEYPYDDDPNINPQQNFLIKLTKNPTMS